jgi:exopolyphosphatase/guanosine-5'-triphosphate,3'-diphosphate pyrophosphatase
VRQAVSVHAHHTHTSDLDATAPLRGFPFHVRVLVRLVAGYPRGSLPARDRAAGKVLWGADLGAVRKLATILRVAAALDRRHQQPVRRLGTSTRDRAVRIAITARGPLDLELWDAEREAALFRRVFGRRLVLAVA